MVKIYIESLQIANYDKNCGNLTKYISKITHLTEDEYYLLQNGRILSPTSHASTEHNVRCVLRTLGGKGGFGSMLRAIGAQIEKTTNREACRDLSGRRLRDINEEKRMKAWLEKQSERDREAEERKKKKIEKLLHVPKHEFKDAEYEETRSKLTEKVNDAVEEGFKQSVKAEPKHDQPEKSRKRKTTAGASKSETAKKKKGALWIGDDISGSSSDSDSDCSAADEKQMVAQK